MGEIEDPEKKKKKEEKAKEKELKKLKAAQKAEAAAAAKAAQASQPSKKLEQKTKRSPASNVEEDSVNPFTPPGAKKILSTEMAKGYMPALVEASWYEWWEKSGFFTADPNSSRPPFVMVIPPPNVTGALHIGHALTCAIEDTIARWRRMSGYNVLWVPGVDHAGIATQVVVEKKLMKERKLTRHDVGREGFVAEVWKWKEQYGGTIFRQLRRLGSSLDWTRECFTMDDIRCKAVIEAFVQLHKENLIYRDNRLVNWDCTLRTAISDIEVEYIDLPGRTSVRVPGYETTVEFGAITSFAYPLEGDLGEIIVATTRPETMLGDTAIAVHPDDPRYLKLHGKFAIHPFNGRKLAIICDRELVDMSFGTGAVKITPAHDPNDYKVGKRHNLPFINIFTDDGNINSNGGTQFQGLKRFDARVAVVTALEEKGLYKGVADNPMRLGICSRSNDVIEPIIKPQWYVSCAGMAKAACDAVKNGELEIIPSQFEDVWFRWLEDIRDWCVSRQLWWGHRVPAWYVTLEDDDMKELGAYNDHWIVARNEDDANSAAAAEFPGKSYRITQDPDVLDTWFSSGLFPFSVMGWPEDTLDLKTFYPTFLLETGHDILFFWVARMVMLGMRLTGHTPFKQVYLHAMVRDAHGRKMSKSLGNVIDPLEIINGVTLEALHKRLEESNLDSRELEKAKAGQVADFPDGIEECGTDALRLGLIAYTMQSVNINLDIQRIVSYRQWCNKLWNAIKFAMMKLGDDFVPSDKVADSSLPFSCRWILSGLNLAIKTTNDSFEKYELSRAATAIYSWWYYELCDVFIEVIKPGLAGDNMTLEKQIIKNTLWHCLETGLRLLHPIMPFVTEELWQRLPGRQDLGKGTIMLADYPKYREEWANEEVREQMSLVTSVVKVVRNLRDVYNVHPRQRPELFVGCRTDNSFSIIEDRASDIATLAALSIVKGLRQMDSIPHGCVVQIVDENVTAYLLLKGVVDFMLEISRMEKRKEQLMRDQETLLKKINIPGYTEKVPTKIQEDNQKKSEKITLELQNVNETIHNFQELLIQD